jgi:hypothetical protein
LRRLFMRHAFLMTDRKKDRRFIEIVL